jgi:hypothetical protein
LTAELFGFAPPNSVAFVLAWLKPLGPLGSKRWSAGEPLPYRMVNRVGGTGDLFSDDPLISVHTFAGSETDAAREADITHRRLLVLMNEPLTDVVMADGQLANLEYLEITEGPRREDYADTSITRYVARYRLGLHFVAV